MLTEALHGQYERSCRKWVRQLTRTGFGTATFEAPITRRGRSGSLPEPAVAETTDDCRGRASAGFVLDEVIELRRLSREKRSNEDAKPQAERGILYAT